MSWFPLAEDMMEAPCFQKLSPTDKLVYWWLTSEYNLRDGTFYLSDLQFAVTLDCSEKTIQRARKSLHSMGLIYYSPGRKDRHGRGLATQYRDIVYAKSNECRWFAMQHRHTFEMMLDQLRRDVFQPGDIITYIYLNYWRLKNGGNNNFFISKRNLADLTNLYDAPDRVKRLYEKLTYNGGSHLFAFTGYQTLAFSEWNEACDPEKSEKNRTNAEEWKTTIRDTVSKTKEGRQLLAISQKPGAYSKTAWQEAMKQKNKRR